MIKNAFVLKLKVLFKYTTTYQVKALRKATAFSNIYLSQWNEITYLQQ